jgi:hypothetical protein
MSLPWHIVSSSDACSGCIGIRRLSLECIGGLAVGVVVVPLVVIHFFRHEEAE